MEEGNAGHASGEQCSGSSLIASRLSKRGGHAPARLNQFIFCESLEQISSQCKKGCKS